jgi:hypothetical protein
VYSSATISMCCSRDCHNAHRSRQKTGRVMINSSNKGANGISNGSSSLIRSSKGSHTGNDTAAIQRSVALGSGGLQGYLRNAQEALYTTTWQVCIHKPSTQNYYFISLSYTF